MSKRKRLEKKRRKVIKQAHLNKTIYPMCRLAMKQAKLTHKRIGRIPKSFFNQYIMYNVFIEHGFSEKQIGLYLKTDFFHRMVPTLERLVLSDEEITDD